MRIEHIDEVKPAIAGRTDFVIAERDGYTAIDYVYALPDSFDDPIRRECRGLKFGRDGSLIARPFGKFFNIGERPETLPHMIDFTREHIVMEKLDGSMVHPAIVDGEVVFMTRMGRSDHAKQAEHLFLTAELAEKCRAMLGDGVTPIFEYTGPKNRIIIRYAAAELTLLAARRTYEGTYQDRWTLANDAQYLGVPLVAEIASEWQDAAIFLDFVRVIQGKEGFVLRFPDEHPERVLLKAKGEDYVLKHKSKEAISMEKNVLALILTNGLDDVLPLLNEEERKGVEEYREEVQSGLGKTSLAVEALVEAGKGMDQKAFAVGLLGDKPSVIRALAFSARKSEDAAGEVRKLLLKNVHTQTQVDAMRDLFGAAWKL
jgi:RNA ligase